MPSNWSKTLANRKIGRTTRSTRIRRLTVLKLMIGRGGPVIAGRSALSMRGPLLSGHLVRPRPSASVVFSGRNQGPHWSRHINADCQYLTTIPNPMLVTRMLDLRGRNVARSPAVGYSRGAEVYLPGEIGCRFAVHRTAERWG